MEITGFVAVGNGEPCPVCGKPFDKADDCMKHIEDEHKNWMMKQLYPDCKVKLMKKIIKYSLMWATTTLVNLVVLDLANDIGGYWINLSWVMAVWFGIETILYLEIIKEWKKTKVKQKGKDE